MGPKAIDSRQLALYDTGLSNSACSLADVAQLVEQLICNQQVRGSIPLVSSVVPTPSHKRTPLLRRRGSVSDAGDSQARVQALWQASGAGVGCRLGGVTEWLMVADCKSAGLTPYVGSNPTPTMADGRTGGRADGKN